jgi:hypothetical protein
MYLIALLSSMTPPLLTIKTRAPPMGAERLKKQVYKPPTFPRYNENEYCPVKVITM